MSDAQLNVLAVVGSMRSNSVTGAALRHAAAALHQAGCAVDALDLGETPLALYNPDTAYGDPGFAPLRSRVQSADVILLGTPDYHGSISSALKNFLDHFWKEFTGKLLAAIVSSHEKGLTVHDQLRTVARQCYAWSLPYGVSLQENLDVRGGVVVSDTLKARLEMLARDVVVYGKLLATQREADLAGTEPGFLAQLRK